MSVTNQGLFELNIAWAKDEGVDIRLLSGQQELHRNDVENICKVCSPSTNIRGFKYINFSCAKVV